MEVRSLWGGFFWGRFGAGFLWGRRFQRTQNAAIRAFLRHQTAAVVMVFLGRPLPKKPPFPLVSPPHLDPLVEGVEQSQGVPMGALQRPPCRAAFGIREAEERRRNAEHRRHRQRRVSQIKKGAQHQHLTCGVRMGGGKRVIFYGVGCCWGFSFEGGGVSHPGPHQRGAVPAACRWVSALRRRPERPEREGSVGLSPGWRVRGGPGRGKSGGHPAPCFSAVGEGIERGEGVRKWGR